MKKLLLILLLFCVSFTATAETPPLVFVIAAHVKNNEQDQLWQRCYSSIREFYPDMPIVIIDDNSAVPLLTGDLHNAQVIRSEFPGAGELLPYYYFLKYRWAEKMVFLHDSMLIRRRFREGELNSPVKFHWHFETHCWDDWEDKGKIDFLLAHLKKCNELINFNRNKSLWHGCFGVACIMDLNVIDHLEETYAFPTALVNVVRSRQDRMSLERLLAILLFKENYVTKSDCSNFGDIYQFPRYGHVDEAFLEVLKKKYPGAILKTWHGR